VSVELDTVQEVLQNPSNYKLSVSDCCSWRFLSDCLEVSNFLETSEKEGGKDSLGEDVIVVSPVIMSAEIEECSVVI